MWAGMMVAMMLPSAMPMILTFAAVSRKRREQHALLHLHRKRNDLRLDLRSRSDGRVGLGYGQRCDVVP